VQQPALLLALRAPGRQGLSPGREGHAELGVFAAGEEGGVGLPEAAVRVEEQVVLLPLCARAEPRLPPCGEGHAERAAVLP